MFSFMCRAKVFYYSQAEHLAPEPSALPANAVCCGGSTHTSHRPAASSSVFGLVGYARAVEAAETAFRSHFPALRWLSELEAGDGAAAAGGQPDEERDAVDELQEALGNL